MLKTPVLLILFNRPDTTQLVFDSIKRVKPKYLYIAADGPRVGNSMDILKCQETREIITQVNWDCELRTLFHNSNKGCGKGPAEAITWFFKNVEQGIILEDDCIPNDDFFKFLPLMLERYRYDTRISLIIGTNFLGEWKPTVHSYFFSLFAHTWGWGTWRRAWELYDFELKDWGSTKSKKLLRSRLNDNTMYWHLRRLYDYTKKHAFNVTWWDFQWLNTIQISDGLCIVPSVNLVKNIGIREDASHTFINSEATPMLQTKSLTFPIIENFEIIQDKEFDRIYFRRAFKYERRTIKKRLNSVLLRFRHLFPA
jgi:hypothetical protein